MKNARLDIEQQLVANKWVALHEQTPEQLLYFRWSSDDGDQVREEISILFDKQGRVKAWTIWHNKRITGPDQEKGTRKRLDEYIAD